MEKKFTQITLLRVDIAIDIVFEWNSDQMIITRVKERETADDLAWVTTRTKNILSLPTASGDKE